jgi:hypothetical protein
MPTRRQFLLKCSAVAVTASAAPVAVFSGPFPFRQIPLQLLRLSTFAPHVNSAFRVEVDNETFATLQLVEARPASAFAGQSANAEDARYEKFSLLFRGLLAQPLEQGSYLFEHPLIGHFVIFIVPVVTADATACYYEAIFNRPPYGRMPRAGEGNIPTGSPRNKRQSTTESSS